MKNLLRVIALCAPLCGWAQIDYRPIPETGATWIQAEFLYSAYNGHEHATVTEVVYTEGDTLINGVSYCKFGSHAIADWIDNFGSQQNQTSGTDTIPYANGFFRQDTLLRQVFVWNDATQTDELMYDFGNLVVGQPYPATVTNTNYPALRVMAVDSVQLMDGNQYRRWVLGTDAADSGYVSVIEGVGGTNGFTTPIYAVFEQSSRLLCHRTSTQICENWESTFLPPRYSEECEKTLSVDDEKETSPELYPNPASTQIVIETAKAVRTVEICSPAGRLLFREEQPAGVQVLNLDVNSLESGTYIMRVQFADGSGSTAPFQVIK